VASTTVNALAPVVLTPLAYAEGQFTMEISGTMGPDYVIEGSTNLASWSGLATNSSPSTPFQFSDPGAGNLSQRFYRAQLAP
jgi:hypothetical protein